MKANIEYSKYNDLLSKSDNKLIFENDGEILTIECWGEDSVRVRATKSGEFINENWALTEPVSNLTPEITFNEDGTASFKNGNIRVEISALGKLSYYNRHGKLVLQEYSRANRGPDNSSSLRFFARDFSPIPGGDYKLYCRFENLDDEEHLYGMGQYQHKYLDLKGLDLELAQRNSQASVPFLLSSLGYGMLWNNPAVGRATFSKNLTTWEAKSTKGMDYWVTVGDKPSDIEEAYANVTGKVPMMPEYGMGFWQCKLRYRTQDELLETAREYKRRGYPISVIVVDFFHWFRQGDWKFDPTYWQDPDAMVKELKDMGIELMVSVWPTVDYRSENFDEMRRRGYLVRCDRGVQINMTFQGNTRHFDTTNPDARDFVWGKVKENYYDKGIKIFWLDEAEPEYDHYDFDNYRYHIGSDLQVGNIYPCMYAKTFFDGMKAEGQDNIINLIRCAWAGAQKYGSLVWSGDIRSDYKTLRCQYAAGLNMGLAGIPWWTTDIGGFMCGNIYDKKFHELLVRWFEYGTFCPVMRLHGHREPFKPQLGTTGGATCRSGADNEVWTYGEDVEKILVKYMFIRERLKPYIEELMTAAHEKGTPVMRTLFYEFPNDKNSWEDHEEYMFGPDILVAPVMYENTEEREVYLPCGANWRDLWTGETYEGGQTITVKTPIDKIPLFSKNGRDFPIAKAF